MSRTCFHANHYSFSTTLALALWLLSNTLLIQTAHAQEDDTLPWYQIEVVIFENRGYSPHGPDSEAWPRDIFLAYPIDSLFLLTPEELKAREEAGKLARKQTSDAMDDSKLEPGETAFVELDESMQQLRREKNAINRERDMRVLFHKTWRQPVASREQTPSVIVQGGNQYDDHYELEGSVKISVSRYLHVDANLWFTSFEANIGQEDNWWPPLPTPPSKNQDAAAAALDLASEETIYATTTPPWQTQSKQNSNIRFGMDSADENAEPGKRDSLRNYVTREIIKLEQSRRMRSGELHYLDHPKLGIIIRIDTYKQDGEKESDTQR